MSGELPARTWTHEYVLSQRDNFEHVARLSAFDDGEIWMDISHRHIDARDSAGIHDSRVRLTRNTAFDLSHALQEAIRHAGDTK